MWPFGKSPLDEVIEAPHDYGVPKVISDLHEEPALNRPSGSDQFLGALIDDHFRAHAAFIAQLHARVKALEAELESKR